MPGVFSRFRIEALHNRHTIDVPINDNKLVLIGENGIGKSTVVDFIYLFLTNQWHRMLSYEFKSVLAVIANESIEFAKEDLLRSRDVERVPDKLEKAIGKLKSSFTDQVLYLSAYRRIEQDLAPTRLIELHKNQQAKEKNVQRFVDVCNEYLVEKKFTYDNLNFEIAIRQIDDGQSDNLKMSMLSSGEKQIVSLFSQLYLSDRTNYFVIIDEPELSLSVYWQKRFLPDILRSDRCNGLIAATHAPFIINDEQVFKHTHSLEEFRERVR